VPDEHWAFAPALDQAQAIAEGAIRPSELLALYYDRIARVDPDLNSYVLLTRELAEAAAAASEKRIAAGQPLGLLDGVPISIKETASLAGHRNSLGSRVFEHAIAEVDGYAITRLKSEGAVILGKTNAPEFGTRPITEGPMFPPAKNPVDRTRTAGGSSGGAAAALAAGLCALSHGGDGGGSIRIPASCCGLVGLKPSRGRISSGPLLGEDWAGLATTGVIARTVADAALGLARWPGISRATRTGPRLPSHSFRRRNGSLNRCGSAGPSTRRRPSIRRSRLPSNHSLENWAASVIRLGRYDPT